MEAVAAEPPSTVGDTTESGGTRVGRQDFAAFGGGWRVLVHDEHTGIPQALSM